MRTILVVSILTAAMAAGLTAAEVTAPEVVAGRVFLDANGNGTLDEGEKGIPGVRVTDGVDFVTTGGDGAYSIRIGADPTIPARSAQTVGVCWPTGTWPVGPWWFRLGRIKDAGAVNFALRSDVQKLPFVYMHMTDAHEFFNNGEPAFAKFVNAMPADVKFIIDTGDSFRPRSVEEQFNRLFISTVGNHDTWEAPNPPPEGVYGMWTDRLGPVRWSFDHAGIHFVGVDVIGEFKAEAMVKWLEKDLSGVSKNTRIVLGLHYPDLGGNGIFSRLLKDYKVELVHAGHNHAYGWSGGGLVPMVTAYHWQPPGTCNIAVVSKDRIDVGVYCIGCKKEPGRHSRRCPMEWIDHVLAGGIRSHYGRLHSIAAGPLAGRQPVKLADPHVFIRASIDPAGATRAGIRIGAGDSPLEIAYTGDRLVIDGASVPFSFRPGQKTLELTVFAHHNMLTVWANDYFFIEKRVAMEKAGEVSLFAEGGTATVKSETVQEVKADPANRSSSYFCSCGHGVLLRNPVPRE